MLTAIVILTFCSVIATGIVLILFRVASDNDHDAEDYDDDQYLAHYRATRNANNSYEDFP